MRQEFSKRTKLEAFERSGGRCEQCTAKLSAGNIEFHHRQECTFGGDNGLGNCLVLCRNCHGDITRKQATVIARSNRQRNKHLGIKRRSRPLPCSKTSRFKKKINGTVELR